MTDRDAVSAVAAEGRAGVRTGGADLADARPDTRAILLAIVAVILLGWALRGLSTVLVPLIASILIALALMPVRDWVRRRVPEKVGWLGIVAAMTVLVLVLAVFFGGLWIAARQVMTEVPAAAERIAEMLPQPDSAGGPAAEAPAGGPRDDAAPAEGATGAGLIDTGGLLTATGPQLMARFGSALSGTLNSVAGTVLGSTVAAVSALVVIFFLVLLILTESGDWRRKLATIASRRTEWRLTQSADVIAGKVRIYLLVRTGLGLVTGVLYATYLWFFGVDLVLVWAILGFLLNFIPTVGSIIAGLLPTIYALVTKDTGTAVAVAAGLLVIEQVMGNYIDPRVQGDRIAISPLVVLVALLFWVWVWGMSGALLAVPVTVSLIVLGAHVPILRPWALLLSDRTEMSGLKEATTPD